ncbi:cyclase family protein [Lichenifustis flavocetrariae]|uniref:Cyclase family protein n=1 Tax=Lichenifustis flavocetrariae TaxID=2949735 RepID=A0AA41Z133_9HYPH|nr:cyclase family protein [Lichenifustis flavocetrariae]MCW6508470.1 cyclase family protein [Lichenifustis flavocetrariae]
MLVDLTHVFRENMPGFRLRNESGELVEFSARIRPFLTHAQSAPNYDNKASFEISEVQFQTSIGTYMDSPRHRFPDKGDIATLALPRLVLEGVVIDARHAEPSQGLTLADVTLPETLKGKAVLVNFGWDRFWGQDTYYQVPYLARDVLERLRAEGIGLFGVDTINADCITDPERPAHSWLLADDILIVENLTGLHLLHGRSFRFFSIPIPIEGAVAFPVRAFAELRES